MVRIYKKDSKVKRLQNVASMYYKTLSNTRFFTIFIITLGDVILIDIRYNVSPFFIMLILLSI